MAESVTFLDNLVNIIDLKADADKFYADNKHLNCTYFDSTGFAGFPEDTYSAADVRMQVQLPKDEKGNVVFSTDVIMSDGTYSSEPPANKNIQISIKYDEFKKMLQPEFKTKIVQRLINEIKKYADEVGDYADTCKDQLQRIDEFKGKRLTEIAKMINDKLTNANSEFWNKLIDLGVKVKEVDISRNLAIAFESNNSDMLKILQKSTEKLTDGKTILNYETFITGYAKIYAGITRDSVRSNKRAKKLPPVADTPSEIIDILNNARTNSTYRNKFIAEITKLAAEAKRTKGQTDDKFINALYKLFTDTSDTK